MKIIDAHTHFSNVSAFFDAAADSGVDYSKEGLLKEQADCNIAASICMGLAETTAAAFPDPKAPLLMYLNDPLKPLSGLIDFTHRPQNMHVCLGVNPHVLYEKSIKSIRQTLEASARNNGGVVGFKIYAGYYHYHVHDPIYNPIYKMAAEYGLTVAIHTGDTYAENALLEYSHPIGADRLAVAYRDVNFVLCHMGDPWIMDACEVAYKNRNVYLDISGLQAGDGGHIAATEGRAIVMHHYTQGLAYLNNYKKVLFGTDWPLVPLVAYIEFCKKIVPKEAHQDVFYQNAVDLFGLRVD